MKCTYNLPALLAILFLPFFSTAQFVTDYRPAGSPPVSSQLNLVSVVETFDNASTHSRAVNTIGDGSTTSDVWVTSVNNVGTVTLSRRYGVAGVNEQSSAIVRCPVPAGNNDHIIAANTIVAGVSNIWLFRISNAGVVIWSRRYFSGTNPLRAYCIKQAAEPGERYIIAGSSDQDKNILAFKIDAAGNLLWNQRYQGAVAGISDIPKSMILTGNNVFIAGNRINSAGARDIFTIGINPANGAINNNYKVIDNGGRNETNPFINFGNGGEIVLTYTVPVTIGAVTQNRYAFNRLTAALVLIGGTTIYWDTLGLRGFTHTIYRNAAGTGYDIGGGAFYNSGATPNPIFFSVTNLGAFVAASHRRLWPTVPFNSTFMMQDQFVAANRYEHHNFKTVATQNSMSLMRDNSFCFTPTPLLSLGLPATQTAFDYTLASILSNTVYDVLNNPVTGNFATCAGAGGAFRNGGAEGSFGNEDLVKGGAFKLYPTLIRGSALVQAQFSLNADAEVQVRVYNLQSQLVMSRRDRGRKGMNTLGFDLSQLTGGAYFVEVYADGNAWKAKLVKE